MPLRLKFRRRESPVWGITAGQVLCLVAFWGAFAYLASPTLKVWREQGKAKQELLNLSSIEAAKRQWASENPGRVLDDPQRLVRYLPQGRFPESPWGGRYDSKDEQGEYVYRGLLDVNRVTSSPHELHPSYRTVAGESGSAGEDEVRPTEFMAPLAPFEVPVGPGVVEVGETGTVSETGSSGPTETGAVVAETGRGVVVVAEAPLVGLEAEPQKGPRGERFLFTANATDPEGGTLEYSFNGEEFGDSPVWGQRYEELGVKEVSVRVRDEQGLVTEGKTQVEVVNLPPEIRLSPSPGRGYRGQEFRFLATVSDPDGDEVKVRFNRGPWGKATVGKVKAKALGDLKVSAMVEDAHGARGAAEASAQIINQAPSLKVEVDPPTGPRGQEFVFRAVGEDLEGDALEYGFDGGVYQPQDTFRKTSWVLGPQSIRVRARDAHGDESSFALANFEVVNRPPTVSLSASPQTAPRGQEVTFTALGNDPDGDPIEFSFEKGKWGSSPYYRKKVTQGDSLGVSVVARDGFGGESAPAYCSVGVLSEPFSVLWASDPPTRVEIGEWVRFSVKVQGHEQSETVMYSFEGGPYQASGDYEARYQQVGFQRLSVKARDSKGAESQELVAELEVVPPRVLSAP